MITDYDEMLEKALRKYGGSANAHIHLDRANTVGKKYLENVGMSPVEASTLPLYVKQDLAGDLHRGPAYHEDDLRRRMEEQLEMMCGNTKEVWAFIDTTADNVGLRAFKVAMELKEKFKDKIKLKVGAYPVFGFKNSEPERWNVFKEAAEKADYIGTLPERDEREGHIGFDEHLIRVINLAKELHKPVHFQVDQSNDPNQNETETLIQAVRFLGSPEIEEDGPSVWAIHVISPSAYEEERFRKLLDGLLKYSIGVICCPSAAISMHQLRSLKAPIHNSIACVLEMLEIGIEVRIGSDNIADVYIPSGTPDLRKEIWLLSNATRFYKPDVWAKVATGTPLTNMDRELIRRALNSHKPKNRVG